MQESNLPAGGRATSAVMKGPLGIAVDSAGNLYLADRLNEHIRKAAAVGATAPTPRPIATPVPVPGMSTGGLTGLTVLMVRRRS